MKVYDYKVTLKNTAYLELTDADFESIGCTFKTATERDIRNLIASRLEETIDYDYFEAELEREEDWE